MYKPLKIAITADPFIPVPPVLYGGIERIIEMLINGYQQKGHEVHLFAHPDSTAIVKTHPYSGATENVVDAIKNTWLITKTIYSGNFDIIHSFGRLAYIIPTSFLKIPILMSYQREPTLTQIKKAVKLSPYQNIAFSGCSNYITNQISPYAYASTIYNGVEMETYKFQGIVEEDAPLMFLGRLEPIKGAHIAIEVAKKTSKKLIIAGNIVLEFQQYFDKEIVPFLNEDIQYIGPIDDQQKSSLLGKCSAFLMPIEWDEPFGIVMIEAMACGTPVIAFNRGAVPEVITQGVNGFICTSVSEMIDCVHKAKNLNRKIIRQNVESRFSANTIVNDYLELYYKLIDGLKAR